MGWDIFITPPKYCYGTFISHCHLDISDDTGLNRIDIYWLFSFISRTGIWKGTNSIRNINMLNYGIATEDTQLNTKMDSKTTYG